MSESSGSGLVDRGTRRRWLISAAIVVLLHAGLAVGVLTWRNMKLAPPVEIDLTRSSSDSGRNEAQAASQVLAAAPNKTDTASAGPPDQAGQSNSVPLQSMPSAMILPAEPSANQSAVEPGNADTAEAASGMTAPELPSSPQGAEANAPVSNGLTAGGPRPPVQWPICRSTSVSPCSRRCVAIGQSGRWRVANRSARSHADERVSSGQPSACPISRAMARRVSWPSRRYVEDRAHAARARSMGRIEAARTRYR